MKKCVYLSVLCALLKMYAHVVRTAVRYHRWDSNSQPLAKETDAISVRLRWLTQLTLDNLPSYVNIPQQYTHRQTHACSIAIVNIHSSDTVAGARFVCLGSVAGVEPNVSIVKMGAGGVKRDHQ